MQKQPKTNSLFLVLPLAFQEDEHGQLLCESQALNGLEKWAENFDSIDVAFPCKTQKLNDSDSSSIVWKSVSNLSCIDRIKFVPLPWAYQAHEFIRHYGSVRRIPRKKINSNYYLNFAIGGLVGDWAAAACLEAIQLKRSYSVWTDRVEHKVILQSDRNSSLLRRIKNRIWTAPMMQLYHQYVISRSQLGLFHGLDCYDEYARFCPNPKVVHNIHLKPTDIISQEMLNHKIQRINKNMPLKITYAGRAVEMKGVFDWLNVLLQLRQNGLKFEATWLGDGELLPKMRNFVREHNLEDQVHLPGFLSERQTLLNKLQESDIFAFCHKTPESPRCLVEALMSGCVLCGYDSAYPRDLLGDIADQTLTEKNNITALTQKIIDLNERRELLASLTNLSTRIGSNYSDFAVFKHRSDLIKKYA